jgi:hypothetical protein
VAAGVPHPDRRAHLDQRHVPLDLHARYCHGRAGELRRRQVAEVQAQEPLVEALEREQVVVRSTPQSVARALRLSTSERA